MTTAQASRRIDADVHVGWPEAETIAQRLPKSWRERWLFGAGHSQPGLGIQPKFYHPLDPQAGRIVSAQSVHNPDALRREWVESQSLDGVVLSVYDAPALSTFGDIDYPTIVASAVNDWLAETWLEADARFLGTITVATQDPVAAAAEVRRAAAHPRMVQVMLPIGTRLPYGHRHYYPIYEAAADLGLAIAIHAGTEGVGTSVPPTPCGWPGSLPELRVTRSTAFLGHLTSLITEGVFVRFPTLRVIGLETGMAWLAAYLWRFDKNYKGLRSECPWLRELPSEYARRFFRFGSQGAEPAEPPSEFWRMLRACGIEHQLLFSSNYPRWDHETVANSYVLSTSAEEIRPAIGGGNALESYPRLGAAAS